MTCHFDIHHEEHKFRHVIACDFKHINVGNYLPTHHTHYTLSIFITHQNNRTDMESAR